MLFFKRNKSPPAKAEPYKPAGWVEPCWDDKTLNTVTASDRFDVKVTSVTRRTGYGQMRENGEMHGSEKRVFAESSG
jgi:hypothetical protein